VYIIKISLVVLLVIFTKTCYNNPRQQKYPTVSRNLMKTLLIITFSIFALISCSKKTETKLYSLKELEENQFLFKLDSLPKNLEEVLRLDLSGKGIDKIPEVVFKMHNLQELDLSKNAFKDVKGIEALKNLQYLNLGMNRLNDFPLEITKLHNLKEIGLWWNDFKDFPNEFYTGNTKLEALDITSLYNFDFRKNLAEVHKFKYLKRLNLGANQIPELTLKYKYLTNLEELGYIHQEKFNANSIVDSLSNCNKLRIIHFSGNKISQLPKNIKLLENLEELNLFENNIQNLPLEITELKKLKEISLIDNPIDEFKIREIEKIMPKTKIIY
ncbi:leucine-rich repeat domain-containing protein, partial [Chryseobacterium sp. HSC-36S06]|uniref:leucine-rich repeat domain-containing protein n=1 Tax=Chryseobacterium sp. HSC-36S06 TaxID=2910970 RepID=UPI0020A20A92